jgi:DNA polymerase III alpha subunit
MEILIRVGALDGFGQSRTRQFWEARWLHCTFGQKANGQGWLLGKEEVRMKNEETNSGRTERGGSDSSFCILPSALLTEPSRLQRLQWEAELLGFPASGHPLELYPDVAWGTYCPVARLGEHVGQQVVTCGLIIEQRVHHQVTGEPMKFLTLRDRTGMVETELFAQTYKTYGLATVRYPVLEVAASVEPFDNGRGFSLRVLRAGKSRTRPSSQSVPERQGAG